MTDEIVRRAGVAALVLAAVANPPVLSAQPAEAARWERRAQNVTITRDHWGIPHIRGKTDADAVFGMIYAQAEDDFNRIEANYLNAMGRMAEAEGDSVIWRDLRMRLFITEDSLRSWYRQSPAWLQQLMNSWADGLNYFLFRNPAVKPRVLTRFEPWMALSFTEGSIGGDIEQINLRQLAAFYRASPDSTGTEASESPEESPRSAARLWGEPLGSNGIAVAPSHTSGGHALLLINPHTSFYFRSELQMTSDEGLDAYGAVTWGQFFIYQGFNQRAGWMHTSSGVDNIDEYLETVVERGGRHYYRHGNRDRPVETGTVTIRYRTPGGMAERSFPVYRTHHGPVVRREGDRWVTVRLMQAPVQALIQSYRRTKARNYQEFRETMELHTNSSNNTIFADAEGNIAYFHSNFIPRRDGRLDWRRPVDGSDPATEWNGVHSLAESPHVLNPPSGWVYNANNWPWSAAGPGSLRREDYPAYMETGDAETPRGYHALRVLAGRRDFTIESLRDAAYDSFLTAFEVLLPPLLAGWSALPESDSLKARLSQPIGLLRAWDLRWSEGSIPTTLAVFWAEEIARRDSIEIRRARVPIERYIPRLSAQSQLEALGLALARLEADFGSWRTPWGEINRFQRLTGDIASRFDDSAPSIPVGFTSARWGSLASFAARAHPGTRKWYGTSGNSFVAVVEFGPRVRAVAVTAGGASGDPGSPHFRDQARHYSAGTLRPVYFYPRDLEGKIERVYSPGS